ncbi:MAG: site-specific DNA-methyltransferase [Bacilli bacterium]|nr:site-specific DNA-methyltransferase [Bacilli bacterium]
MKEYKIFAEDSDYVLYQGTMQSVIDNDIKENSIDCIITDPPYELNFMNKGWDNSGVAFQKETWERCLKVLKAGGHILAFGGTRTYHRIACAIEDAGFEIRDCIQWIYGSGFPKSLDISKQIDKKGGNDYSKQFAKDLKEAREKRNLTIKYCDDKYCGGSTNWSWYEGRPNGVRVPDYATYLKIVEEFPELEKYKDLIKEAEREVIGTTITNKTVYQNIGGDNVAGEVDITVPETELAKKWEGWGSALKPAYEPIIVARKPFTGSLVDNIIEYGVGGLNVGECKVPYGKETDNRIGTDAVNTSKCGFWQKDKNNGKTQMYKNDGRFPANVILTYDDSDYEEVCGGFPESKGANSQNNYSNGSIYRGQSLQESKTKLEGYREWYNDEGSASRYFYCAKASKKDRDEGLDDFEEVKFSMMASNDNMDEEGNFTGMLEGRDTKYRNIHPTVKPTELMQYLVRLVTPPNGIVMDCFMGSGSTGKAVMFENRERNANYKFIGIEMTEEYLPICKARIDYAKNKFEYDLKKEEQKITSSGQNTLF